MGDDDSFLQAIRAMPTDQALRLVYADWLEDRRDERGEYLRIQAKLLGAARERKSRKELQARYKKLRSRIDPGWLRVTDWPAPKSTFAIRCMLGVLHRWDGCVCSHCEAASKDSMRHAWVGCKCIRCGQTTQAMADRFL